MLSFTRRQQCYFRSLVCHISKNLTHDSLESVNYFLYYRNIFCESKNAIS